MQKYKTGDIVLLPCKVLSTGLMAFTKEGVLDVVPMCKLEQKEYTFHKPWTVFENDVLKEHND